MMHQTPEGRLSTVFRRFGPRRLMGPRPQLREPQATRSS